MRREGPHQGVGRWGGSHFTNNFKGIMQNIKPLYLYGCTWPHCSRISKVFFIYAELLFLLVYLL
jgi:hypothetical protein